MSATRFTIALALSLLTVFGCNTTQAAIRIGIDWNGDGLIQTTSGTRIPVDAPTPEKPFTFWLNHDQDDLETGGETWPISRPDSSTEIKDSSRDLEDFTRLQIEIDDLAGYPEDALLELAWLNGEGGDVNLYRATDKACTRSYLLDKSVGEAQLAEDVLSSVGSVEDLSFRMRLGALGEPDLDGGGFCFLFDAVSAGRDSLVVSILHKGETLERSAPVPIDLRHIKTFYQRTTMDWPEEIRPPWEYTSEQPPIPDLQWRYDPQGYDFQPPWWETDDEVVWIYGWLKSGDIGRQDADGYYYIAGRIKEMYISGGENVYPAEVENVLAAHPGILEAAVVAIPDDKWGEVGRAYLLAQPGLELPPAGEITAWCRERLAPYKVPKEFVAVQDFPRTAAGKIQKHLLGPEGAS